MAKTVKVTLLDNQPTELSRQMPDDNNLAYSAVDNYYNETIGGLGSPVFEDVEADELPLLVQIKTEPPDSSDLDGHSDAGLSLQPWTESCHIDAVSVKDEQLSDKDKDSGYILTDLASTSYRDTEEDESAVRLEDVEAGEFPSAVRVKQEAPDVSDDDEMMLDGQSGAVSSLQPRTENGQSDVVSVKDEPSQEEALSGGDEGLERVKEPSTSDRDSETGSFVCNTCGKSYKRQSHLIRHQTIHPGEKPYKCFTCGEAFRSYNNLKIHAVTHPEVYHNRCTICVKDFSSVASLKVHMRLHTGDRSFKCGKCEKIFRTSEKLKLHSKEHNGQRPFRCETCGTLFAARTKLAYHMLAHRLANA